MSNQMQTQPQEQGRVRLPIDDGRRILSVRERESLRQQIATHTAVVGATEESYGLGTEGGTPVIPPGMQVNKKRLSDQAKELIGVLNKGTPPPLNAAEKDAAWKEVKALKEELLKDGVLETRQELHVTKRDRPEFFTALKKAGMRPQYEAKIERYRNLMRTLEPENELADSLDILRKERD